MPRSSKHHTKSTGFITSRYQSTLRDDSDSSSDSDLESESNSIVTPGSPLSVSSISLASYHSGNSENSGDDQHSIHSDHVNSADSDLDAAGNNSDSDTASNLQGAGGSVASNRSIGLDANDSDSDANSELSVGDQDNNSDIDNISNLSFDDSLLLESPRLAVTDSDSNSSVRLSPPSSPSLPSDSDDGNNINFFEDILEPRTLPAPADNVGERSPASACPLLLDTDSSDSDNESFHSAGRTMTGSAVSKNSKRASTFSFECSVCLENLDAPASIDDLPGDGAAIDADGNPQPQSVSAAPVRGGPRGRNNQRNAALVSPTDLVATHCGHLYHQLCLEKWFTEQGRRTCPSCRKNVPKTKQIRLYPNVSEPGSSKPESEVLTDPNLPGPSSASSSGTGTSATTSKPVAVVAGPCTRPECNDVKVIHNTLINDYTDLQRRYDELRENEELKEAQIRSLEEENQRHANEIAMLKRPSQDVIASPVSASKRRRQ